MQEGSDAAGCCAGGAGAADAAAGGTASGSCAAAVEEAEDALDAAFDEQNGAVQPPVWPAEL